MVSSLGLVAMLIGPHTTGWAWLGLLFDPARAAIGLGLLAFVFPDLAGRGRPEWGNAIGLGLVYAVLLPVTKALFDGPTLPIGSLGMDRRVDGVWYDPGLLLGIAVLGILVGTVSVIREQARRRRLRKP